MSPQRRCGVLMASLALASLPGCAPRLLSYKPKANPKPAAAPAPAPVAVPVRPAPHMAALQLDTTSVLYVAKVNEQPISSSVQLLELAPGVQTLSLRFHQDQIKNKTQRYGEFDLSLDARPGRTYKVEFQTNKDVTRWSAYVWDLSEQRRVSRIITEQD